MEFISDNLALILCGLAGLGLLLGEAFMPGFGVAGVLGIILEAVAIASAWIHHGPVFALIFTAVVILVVALMVFVSYRSALHGRLSRSALVLKEEEAPHVEAAAEKLLAYKGREGVAVSALRPGGTVEVDGARMNAASQGDLVEKGTRVRVLGAEGDHVIVQPL